MAYKLNIDGEDKFLFGLEEALYGGKVENTIKCKDCGDLYKAEGQTFVWEMNDRFKGLCRHCYLRKLNDNFTEEDAQEFAKEALSSRDYMGRPRINPDVDDENWKRYVEPKIEGIVAAEKRAAEEAYHQEKLNEAQQIIDDARNAHPNGNMDPDWFELEVIAKLLERMDKLEKKIPPRDWRNEPFTI